MTTAADLAQYVGARSDDPEAASCLTQAKALVDNYIGPTPDEEGPVPADVLHRAYLEVGAELFWRRTAPNGIKQFATTDGGAGIARVARDPMVGAYPLLIPFVGLGIS